MAIVEVERTGEIAVVRLNRPERLNAISLSLTRALHDELAALRADERVAVIVLTGAGRAFCAGDDLKEFDQQTASPAAVEAHVAGIQQITRDLMFMDKIVVGAVHGYAVGGGFEWLLNCDLVVAADDLVAFFPEMDWGQFVTGGVSHLLPQALGHQRAMELLVLGERQSAADLMRMGLVNRVVSRDAMLGTALELAGKVAAKSRRSVGHLKRIVTQDLAPGLTHAMALEEKITVESFQTAEARERVKRFKGA